MMCILTIYLMESLNSFITRLQKVGVNIELVSNYPWIYLNKINNKIVKEIFMADHGFTIAFAPIRDKQKLTYTNISEIFKLIRKYVCKENAS